jgi:hypothetical protein
MKPRSDDPLDRLPESPRPEFPVWFGSLAPPLAAILHLQFMYVLEHPACSTQSKIGLHAISIALLALDLLGGFVANREWVKLGGDDPGQLPGPLGSRRLLALFGMIGAFIFGLFILAQWFPTFVLPECVRT